MASIQIFNVGVIDHFDGQGTNPLRLSNGFKFCNQFGVADHHNDKLVGFSSGWPLNVFGEVVNK